MMMFNNLSMDPGSQDDKRDAYFDSHLKLTGLFAFLCFMRFNLCCVLFV